MLTATQAAACRHAWKHHGWGDADPAERERCAKVCDAIAKAEGEKS